MSEQRGAAIGRMVQEKNVSYGAAYPRVAKALKALLEEEGVDAGTPLKLSEAQLRELPYVTRLLEKAARVLHGGPQALGEDAWEDVAGIALARLAEQERRGEGCQERAVNALRDGIVDWLHFSTSPGRVACLENVDAPLGWTWTPSEPLFRQPEAEMSPRPRCPYCREALMRVGPGEKPAPPAAAASLSRG